LHRKGFTLIELLVVIAIIAIVAAILFPVFARARAKGRAATCLSNVRQLSMALYMYAEDHDECYPGGFTLVTLEPYWDDVVQPYLRNRHVLTCPDQDRSLPRSYGMAYALHGHWYGQLADPSITVAVGDDVGRERVRWSVAPYSCDPATFSRIYIDPRHHGGVNLAFADGHAKWYPSSVDTEVVWF